MAARDHVVYAFGDVHGRLDLLTALIDGARQDAHARGEAEPHLIGLGDYVDRGMESRGVVELLMSGVKGFHTTFLKGNHEDLLVRSWLGQSNVRDNWLAWGGIQTLISYGADPEERLNLRGTIPEEHVTFLHSLPLFHDDGERFFVHAGINPYRPLTEQREHDLLWIRNDFLRHNTPFERLIVHGHSMTDYLPETFENRINLDTGAFHSGMLSAAVFIPGQRYPSFLLAVSNPTDGSIKIVEMPQAKYDMTADSNSPGF